MPDREKVIKGLEHCVEKLDTVVNKTHGFNCATCPYFSKCDRSGYLIGLPLIHDALALLKAQEPRVMTLEEVKQHNNQDGCVWFEQPTYNADAAFVIKDDFMTQVISPYILGEPINNGYWTNGNYGKTWRCWTSRPTDEQREAVKWE